MNLFSDYKSRATWSKETGELQNLTLSTGEEIRPEKTINSILGLLAFLWEKHRAELTWWGKLSYWMNQ